MKKYLGSVVPARDNFFAALNSAVFSDGSFVYIPKGVRCPMELSTYFRINAAETGQFERTLIVAEDASYVSYLEGCTAPMRDENQLHAAVVHVQRAAGHHVLADAGRVAHADGALPLHQVQPVDAEGGLGGVAGDGVDHDGGAGDQRGQVVGAGTNPGGGQQTKAPIPSR